jgi:hypothetical protein
MRRARGKATGAGHLDLEKWRTDEPNVSKAERDRTLKKDRILGPEVQRIQEDVLRIKQNGKLKKGGTRESGTKPWVLD